ncbi:hypothetical protein [Halomonas halocynthiae]|uniref:hypothetical protein n=1 Tax=Halomonas halocynthiae TaxID=176290 RepID=UPI00040583E3|nr:hypothetical protein [Halomonas halocynthiae]
MDLPLARELLLESPKYPRHYVCVRQPPTNKGKLGERLRYHKTVASIVSLRYLFKAVWVVDIGSGKAASRKTVFFMLALLVFPV